MLTDLQQQYLDIERRRAVEVDATSGVPPQSQPQPRLSGSESEREVKACGIEGCEDVAGCEGG